MNRTVTVWESTKQKKTVIENSSATTLGELKAEMLAHDIDLNNMDILEGVSHTKLLSDDSALPHDIPYKGNITNDLMIYLTLQNKKVASGAISRQEIGQWIKENNLGEEVKAAFGDNWTRVTTPNFVAFYESKTQVSSPAQPASEPKKVTSEPVLEPSNAEAKAEAALKAIDALTEALYDDEYIYSETYNKVKNIINQALPKAEAEEVEGGFSMDEINSMIDGM